MKHGTHPKPRQSLLATVASAALALLLGASTQSVSAQDQSGSSLTSLGEQWNTPNLLFTSLYTAGGGSSGCAPKFAVVNPLTEWGTVDYGGVENYYNMPVGDSIFTLQLDFSYAIYPNVPTPSIQLFVDGSLSTGSSVTYIAGGEVVRVYRVNYRPSNTSDMQDGAREFAFRLYYPGIEGPRYDIRFKAMIIGTSFTNVLGYYNAPQLPLTILRDPPGDASYSTIDSSASVCSGATSSMTTGGSQAAFFKARLGVAGSIGLIATVDYEIYVEAGVDMSASQSQTAANEYTTCFSTSTHYSTSQTGPPDDVFIGSSVRYAYGMAIIVSRIACDSVSVEYEFISAPTGTLGSYNYTESYIREDVIPDLIADIAAMAPGAERDRAETQLSVWNQTLAMNDAIKANAPFEQLREFNGGGQAVGYELTTTTTQAYTIDYEAQLEGGLSLEFGVNIGGSGITAGGSVRFQQGYGRGQNGSNETTNTVGYHLGDDDSDNQFDVNVFRDEVFGTYVFQLDSAESETSCPYEGGYQIDQPSLSVGSIGNTTMVVNEAPVGQPVTFPLYICNNSNDLLTYNIKVKGGTNTEGGVIVVLGENISSDILGQECEDVPANGCYAVAPLTITDGNPFDLTTDFVVEVYLYAPCDPGIRSSVFLEAHFGAGNFGSVCVPTSDSAAISGDWIDGVQLQDIDNTGTGGPSSGAYTDYSAQFSTPLSRNAARAITLTGGAHFPDRYAVWIDYDNSGSFDASEKLAADVITSAPFQSITLPFTVPGNATLGSTLMRVRGARDNAALDPCFSYTFGETEDYTVVIDGNTPQDCAGVNNGTALPGTSCDDNDANTGNDTWTANCQCVGQTIDCVGIPGGTTTLGSPCDDGDTNTGEDAYDGNCLCAGLTYDCVGIPGGTAVQGAACDDGDVATGNDVYDGSCLCAGQLIDCLGVIGGATTAGTPCDDGNPLSGGDAYNANCECVGAFATDCAGVEGGTAQPGTPCDDNDGTTGNDMYSVNCVCAGEAYDCAGIVGGAQLPGTPCDDGNPDSNNDVFTADCGCLGVLANDCAGVPGGTAQPGTACDDGDANTGNDVYNAFCECAGQLIDCDGVAGGFALPGSPCDDGNAATGADLIDANCQCAGLLLDCLGVPGGTTSVGTACDDADANTSNDVYTANCICAGVLANDCEGVAGGTAQPGTTCDDGDATTGNDAYDTNCECAGEVIDCEGTAGGTVLPGTHCDDGDNCTTNDVRGTDCACSGTTITIGAVTGSTMVFGNTTNVYLVTPVANATSYNWTLPNGWTTSDNGAFALVAGVNNIAGPVELCVTAMVGDCELTSCITVNVDFNTGIATTNASSEDWFTVQPNPSNGMFQLRPSTTDATPLRISIRNGLGQEVLAPFTVAGQRTIDMDLSDVAAGAYYLLATRNGEQQVIKIMVQR